MLTTITDKRLLDKERTVTSFRYFVHIVSQHQEDDGYGYPVPVGVTTAIEQETTPHV